MAGSFLALSTIIFCQDFSGYQVDMQRLVSLMTHSTQIALRGMFASYGHLTEVKLRSRDAHGFGVRLGSVPSKNANVEATP